jgi:hypothetical protein
MVSDHDEEVDVAVAVDVVERDDVGVIQRRGGPRLLQEATLGIVATNRVARKHFDGDGPMQPRIAGAVDLAHAP